MAWVQFTENFDWRIRPGVTKAFKGGLVANVPTPAAKAAVAAGKARRVRKPETADEAQALAAGAVAPDVL